jgi:hypothetical protein
MVRDEIAWSAKNSDQDMMYEGRGGSRTRQSRVAVLYPIEHVCLDDYGCEWEWLPSTPDFLFPTSQPTFLQAGVTSKRFSLTHSGRTSNIRFM